MKKTIKRILLAIGVIILLIVLFVIGYGYKAQSEIKTMTPAETGEIVENIFSVKDSFANLYLIKDSLNYIAIDAGNNMEVISEELTKLNINPDMVSTVLLTHTDGDHVAAISLFKNAKVYLSAQEEQLINGEESRSLFFGNSIDAEEYALIGDQQIFSIGNINVKGILNPGHTLGSMSFLVNNKYLFTGDALSLKDGRVDKFNEFFNMDTETAIKSIENITKISEAEYIFTAHHGYTDNYKSAVSEWGNKRK
ncbi:MAG: MBL fold metallo-hydrolase [Bacteroidales bacterium]|jgi:hydroxyacylglutathione hydrolase|nr:MBL fold metallo-hydrolase [Bacteroidales bacterium]